MSFNAFREALKEMDSVVESGKAGKQTLTFWVAFVIPDSHQHGYLRHCMLNGVGQTKQDRPLAVCGI